MVRQVLTVGRVPIEVAEQPRAVEGGWHVVQPKELVDGRDGEQLPFDLVSTHGQKGEHGHGEYDDVKDGIIKSGNWK